MNKKAAMSAEEAIALIRDLCSAVGDNVAAWHRGGTKKGRGNRQTRAVSAVFTALTGRKPTAEEKDNLSATAVWGR